MKKWVSSKTYTISALLPVGKKILTAMRCASVQPLVRPFRQDALSVCGEENCVNLAVCDSVGCGDDRRRHKIVIDVNLCGVRASHADIDRRLDIGKNIFHLVGFVTGGQIVLRRKIKRLALVNELKKLPPCLVGMEAYLSAHFVSRTLRGLGHEPRIIRRST